MGTLTVRNLPDDVHALLRVRAALAGRSMEAEVRAILADSVREPAAPVDADALQAFVASMYGGSLPAGVVDELISERRAEAKRE